MYMEDIPNRHTLTGTLKAEVPALSHAEVLLPGIRFFVRHPYEHNRRGIVQKSAIP